MAEEDRNVLIIIIGYLLAIFEGVPLGFVYGLLLYFLKKESEYYRFHAKIIIVLSLLFFIILFAFLAFTVGLAVIGFK